jgi:hypothetical protein
MTDGKPEPSEEEIQKELDELELATSTFMAAGSWLPTKQAVLTATISLPASDVYDAAKAVIGHLGRRHPFQAQPAKAGGGAMRGRFGSGWANMNATIVDLQVRPQGGTGADLRIRASAKEGLLNQHSSEKAARRVRDAISAKLGGVEIGGEPTAIDT